MATLIGVFISSIALIIRAHALPSSTAAASQSATAPPRRVVVNAGQASFGPWEGWGVSLSWWANIWGITEPSLAAAIFSYSLSVTVSGITAPALGLTTARYNAGGSSNTPAATDGSRMVASPNIPVWKQIETFWVDLTPTPSSWDWTRDARQVAMLQGAARAGAERFELFSNSPPWWMLANHNPSGSNDGSSDNLLPEHYRNHSKYLATIAAHARDVWGINFTSVELFNEPVADWWKANGTQEGCHFDAASQAAALATLPAALTEAGFTVGSLANNIRIAASDESRIDMAASTWAAWKDATRATLQQFNVHGYQIGGDCGGLYQSVVVEGGKVLHDTEYGDGDATGGLMAQSILADWSTLHPSAWHYWQIIDVTAGWGLREGDATTGVLGALNTKWYVLAQFARHIRMGAEILHVTTTTDTAGGKGIGGGIAAAVLDAARDNTLTLVLQNYGASNNTLVDIDLTAFAIVPAGTGGAIAAWITSTKTAKPTPNQSYTPFENVTVGTDQIVRINMPVRQEELLHHVRPRQRRERLEQPLSRQRESLHDLLLLVVPLPLELVAVEQRRWAQQ